jgi:hypothetical protein
MPSPTPNVSQVINGIQWDWSSVEIQADHRPFGGVKSLDWNHGLEPGEGRGTRAQVALRSRGKYSADGSMEMYAFEYQLLIAQLAANGARGYMEQPFDIAVNYVEKNLPMVSFAINHARIKKEARSHSEDGGILTVKCDLHIMSVVPTVPGTNTPLFAVEPTKFIR